MMYDLPFMRQPRFYQWDTPQYWDTLYQQHLCETSTDKKLSGEPSEPIEESSKELGPITQLLKRLNMSQHESENELIIKAVRWAAKACAAIQDAGGSVNSVLERFPDELIMTMVRNGIQLKHER